MRLFVISLITFCVFSIPSKGSCFIPDNQIELVENKSSSQATVQEKGKQHRKRKSLTTKPKSARKLRFTKPFMFLNPLISHLLFLTPTQESLDTLGA